MTPEELAYILSSGDSSDLDKRLARGQASAERFGYAPSYDIPAQVPKQAPATSQARLAGILSRANDYMNALHGTVMSGIGPLTYMMPVGEGVAMLARALQKPAASAVASIASKELPPLERPVNYGGIEFTPEQWAQAVRSRMPENTMVGDRGFVNVPEGATPAEGMELPPPAPKPTPIARGPRTYTDNTAEYSPAEKQRVYDATMRARADKAAAEADRARVRDAALKARKDNKIVDQISDKDTLDADTRRLLGKKYR